MFESLIGRKRPHDPTKAELAIDELALDEPVRLDLRFVGFVQGVGFRYTQVNIAKHEGVTGWVENLDDGSVAAEWQGTGAAVKRMVAQLRSYYGAYGAGFSIVKANPLPLVEESGFEVIF